MALLTQAPLARDEVNRMLDRANLSETISRRVYEKVRACVHLINDATHRDVVEKTTAHSEAAKRRISEERTKDPAFDKAMGLALAAMREAHSEMKKQAPLIEGEMTADSSAIRKEKTKHLAKMIEHLDGQTG